MAARIEASGAPEEQKATLLSKLRALPAEAVQRVTLRLAEAGADRGLDFVRTLLEQAPS